MNLSKIHHIAIIVNRSTWKMPSSLTTRLAAIVIRLTVSVLSAILSNSSVVAEIRILPRLVGLSSFVLPCSGGRRYDEGKRQPSLYGAVHQQSEGCNGFQQVGMG